MMHFPEQDYVGFIDGFKGSEDPIDEVGVKMAEDWLEQHAEIDRLREAAAAVVDGWEDCTPNNVIAGSDFDILVQALRIAAGIPAPPADTASRSR